MSKYNYIIITTKSNLSEAEHSKVLSNYGEQGYKLVREKKHLFGTVTYVMERATEVQKMASEAASPSHPNSRQLLIVPGKYILEMTEFLLKGIEAQKDLPVELKKTLIEWVSINRPDLVRNGKVRKDG